MGPTRFSSLKVRFIVGALDTLLMAILGLGLINDSFELRGLN